MHSSLSFFVSGQAQQIFFFGFDSGAVAFTAETWFCCEPGKAKAEESFSKGNPPILSTLGDYAICYGRRRTVGCGSRIAESQNAERRTQDRRMSSNGTTSCGDFGGAKWATSFCGFFSWALFFSTHDNFFKLDLPPYLLFQRHIGMHVTCHLSPVASSVPKEIQTF